jgi:hypothetical protein
VVRYSDTDSKRADIPLVVDSGDCSTKNTSSSGVLDDDTAVPAGSSTNTAKTKGKAPVQKIASKVQPGPAQLSEYERTKTINVARNKVILGILDKTVEGNEVGEVLAEELKKVGIELDDGELKAAAEK